jgi:hypothetical protein
LDLLLQGLSVVFTQPSAVTFQQVFVAWIMCLGRRTEFRVFEAFEGEPVCRRARHPFDRFYNFFSRSAWSACLLADSCDAATARQRPAEPGGLGAEDAD